MSEITRKEMEGLISLISHHNIHNTTITIVTLQLDSGYVVSGESACARVETFDEKVGIEMAKDKAFGKLKMLLEFKQFEDEYEGKLLDPTKALALRTHPDLLIAAQAVDLACMQFAKRVEYGQVPDALNIAWSNLRTKIGDAGGEVAQ